MRRSNMARDRRADPHCDICHGTGAVPGNERVVDGEYWCSYLDCICIETYSAEMADAHAAYADYLKNGGTSLDDLRKELEG
jgi:hypothetical protein